VGTRRSGRTAAVKILYILDIVGGKIDEICEDVAEGQNISAKAKEFAQSLVKTTWENLDEIDKTVSKYLVNWSFERLAVVDRAILRTGAAELIYFPEIPPKVTIDEYVEIAKKYSTERSPSFVNAVLDQIAKGLELL